jgi:prolyl 4-hydroxylase
MQFDSLAVDLRHWLKDNIERGFDRDTLVQSLRAAGHQPKFARQAVDLALARFRPASQGDVAVLERPQAATAVLPDARPAAEAAAPSAEPPAHGRESNEGALTASEIIAESGNAIETSDRRVNILFALNAPRVVLFDGLLSAEECDEMVRLSRAKLQRSTVVNAATGEYDVHPDRTSSGTHFQRGENPLVRRIERRISELVACPVEHGEPIQILHYLPGAEYKPHFDYFDPGLPGNDKVLAMGGQRVATLVMYLNEVEAGGSTVFPDIGLDVLPRKGNAVFFAYATEDGQLDRRTLHGGSPVGKGEKWIATKWLRQGPYVGPSA